MEDIIATFGLVILTAVIAFAALVQLFATVVNQINISRLQKRLNWLMGSMESYERTRLIMEAEAKNIDVVWWDPNHRRDGIKDWGRDYQHNEPADIDVIRVGLPLELRAKTSTLLRLNRWVQAFLLWVKSLPEKLK